MPSYVSDFREFVLGVCDGTGKVADEKGKEDLAFHFYEDRNARAIATHCGLARRSVAQTLERFAASGRDWAEACDMDKDVLEGSALSLIPGFGLAGGGLGGDRERPVRPWHDADAAVGGMARGIRRDELSDLVPPVPGMRPRRDVTMRQNRRPGERLFVDYAGMTAPLLVDGVEHEAQVFVASMGVSGRLYAEATLTQKIEDWCASHVRASRTWAGRRSWCSGQLKSAVTQPSRYEPVLNETYADLLEHFGVQGLPARVRRPRDKDSSNRECFTLSAGSWRHCATMSSMIWRR